MVTLAQLIPQLKSIQLTFKERVDSYIHGAHQGLRRGIENERMNHRLYQPGDDIRHIDWRLYSRSDRYFVKEGNLLVRRQIKILLDLSASMRALPATANTAILGALALAYCLLRNHDKVQFQVLGMDLQEPYLLKNETGLYQIEQHLNTMLERTPVTHKSKQTFDLTQFKRRTHEKVILFTDLYIPLAELRAFLAQNYVNTGGLTLFHVHDMLIPQIKSNFLARLIDSENGSWLPGNAIDQLQSIWEAALSERYRLIHTHNAKVVHSPVGESPLRWLYRLEAL